MTEAELHARFQASARETLGAERTGAIERFIDRLEESGSAGDLPRISADAR